MKVGHGARGWLAVAAVVLITDATGQTMSTAYREALRKHPILVLGATGYIVSHLTGTLPRRVDALRAAGTAWSHR